MIAIFSLQINNLKNIYFIMKLYCYPQYSVHFAQL